MWHNYREKKLTFYNPSPVANKTWRAYALSYNTKTHEITFEHLDVSDADQLRDEAFIRVADIKPIGSNVMDYMNSTLLPLIQKEWKIVLTDGTGERWTTPSTPMKLGMFLDMAM